MFEETKNESLRQLLQLTWDSNIRFWELYKKMEEKGSMELHELRELEQRINDYPIEIREAFSVLGDLEKIDRETFNEVKEMYFVRFEAERESALASEKND